MNVKGILDTARTIYLSRELARRLVSRLTFLDVSPYEQNTSGRVDGERANRFGTSEIGTRDNLREKKSSRRERIGGYRTWIKTDRFDDTRTETKARKRVVVVSTAVRGERYGLSATFPPKRNLKVGKTGSTRAGRHPLLLMKLPPTHTFNFPARALLLLLSGCHPTSFPLATLSPPLRVRFVPPSWKPPNCLFYPLNGRSPSTRVRRLISCRVHILLVLRPLLLSFIPSSLPTLIFRPT